MSAVAILFAGMNERRVPELTSDRTMASVPFACRYRLIDFMLSNVVNAGITKVGVLTHYNYESLMDHLGTGKDWDLARRNGGLKILPPFITAFANRGSNELYASRLEALVNARNFLSDSTEDTVLISDCDLICNLDLGEMLRAHRETGADVTVAVQRRFVSSAEEVSVVLSDADGRFIEATRFNDVASGTKDVQVQLLAVNRQFLLQQLTEAMAHGYHSLTRDLLNRCAGTSNLRIYRFEEYCETVGSLADYYRFNMAMLDPEVRKQLFGVKNRPILTRVWNSVPTTYAESSLVKNSLVADGCVIEGIVENSILFRGVHVGKNTSVENCILMPDTYIGNNAYLNCVITDKSVTVRDGRVLSGHESRPFYIEKFIAV
ncbi:MAG: glucose-1-phosphate adenylyltransferase subunit GlgD [Oscillospiraceae bacterium]|nr:glucose-1-phosphate adenylyltransferase subunit GlgD [Oscillospiraceae bacterium]